MGLRPRPESRKLSRFHSGRTSRQASMSGRVKEWDRRSFTDSGSLHCCSKFERKTGQKPPATPNRPPPGAEPRWDCRLLTRVVDSPRKERGAVADPAVGVGVGTGRVESNPRRRKSERVMMRTRTFGHE